MKAPAGYMLSHAPADMQLARVHAWLAASYWAKDMPLDVLECAAANSLCVGAFTDGTQIGFARAVTDRATFAYVADVFVEPAHRGRGICAAMMTALQGLRRWLLVTRDAHVLYAALGWEPLTEPQRFMQRHFPNVYAS